MNADQYQNAVDRYFEVWNTTDPEALAKAVSDVWTEDGTYTDPMVEARGPREIAEFIAAAHARFPGFEYRPLGRVDGHHDLVRFGWELVSTADGSAPIAGFDVVTLTEDGRVRSVKGFLDRVPTA
ncbi:nuclear transport factor 2 family protein (plasmid) [Streptomyces sp. BI20]|uniref:nuclear transport factor 2 family protein n=1 Tax=Streptomyces sp. BI20 TaxID=3403460 RepID=UPI003C73B8D4